MPSYETSGIPERNHTHEQTARYCRHINDALVLARRIRLAGDEAPEIAGLHKELAAMMEWINHEGAAGNLSFHLLIPPGANARISSGYTNIIDEHPREFIAEKVSRLDEQQADFFRAGDAHTYLTSFDLDLQAEPLA